MQFPLEIEKRINKGKPHKNLINMIYVFMKEFNQPYSEILELPIPLANELLKLWEKLKKEEAKAYKKKR